LADHVRRAAGLEVLEVEKYQYNYYVTVGRNGKPLQELLVFPNRAIHPEPQSMMWLGQPMYIDNATALAIAKKWLDTYFPGTEVKEVYVSRLLHSPLHHVRRRHADEQHKWLQRSCDIP